MKLEGEKIYLKPFTVEHAENFVRWSHDTEVCRFLTVQPKTMKEELEFIKNREKEDDSDIIFAIHLKENNKHIGNCGLHISKIKELPDVKTVGLMIGEKNEWGKGYGTETMKTLLKYVKDKGNKEVYLSVHVDNISAINCYKKCGFEIYAKEKAPERTNSGGEHYVMRAEL